MATVSNTIKLNDKMSPVLGSIIKALQSTIDGMAGVDKVSNSAFKKMQKDIQNASSVLNDFNNNIVELPTPINKGAEAFGKWKANIITINQGLQLIRSSVIGIANQLSNISDLTNQQSRLKSILADNEDIYDIQEKINRSSQIGRSSYQSTLNSVVAMKSAMSEYGLSTEGAIRMSELLNKSLALGGTKGAAAESVMYNLQQSLSTGVVRWEDWKIVASNSIYLAEVVAKNLGVTKAELSDLVKAGQVSAADFTDALLTAGEIIDAEFGRMPETFVDWMTSIKSFATGKFLEEGGLHDKILALLSSSQFLSLVDGIKNALVSMIDTLSVVLDYVLIISNWIGENWNIIAPIIWGIVGAFIAYNAIMLISAISTAIADGAMKAFFVTLLSNPLTWILLLIGGLIAITYAWVDSIGGLQNAWEIAKMSIALSVQWLQLAFHKGVNGIINMTSNLSYAFSSLGVAVSGHIGNMRVSVLQGLQTLINGAIELINSFLAVLNKIPGVSIDAVAQVTMGATAAAQNEANRSASAERLSQAKDDLDASAESRASEMAAMQASFDKSALALGDVVSAAKSQANKQNEVTQLGSVGDYSKNDYAYKEAISNASGLGGLGGSSKAPKLGGGKLDEIGKIKDEIDISDENIKLLKDVASTEFINQYTTMTPNMSVQFGDVTETADVNKILAVLETMVEDAYASVLVGGA